MCDFFCCRSFRTLFAWFVNGKSNEREKSTYTHRKDARKWNKGNNRNKQRFSKSTLSVIMWAKIRKAYDHLCGRFFWQSHSHILRVLLFTCTKLFSHFLSVYLATQLHNLLCAAWQRLFGSLSHYSGCRSIKSNKHPYCFGIGIFNISLFSIHL